MMKLAVAAFLVPLLAACTNASGHSSAANTVGSSVPSSGQSVVVSPIPSAAAAPSAPTPAARVLTQRSELSLPVKVQETAAAATADRLYVIAGYDAASRSTARVFEFDGASWSTGPSLPIPLNHPAAASLGGAVYVAGGFGPSGATNRAFVLDASAGSWREIPSMRHARGANVLLASGGKLYAIGGRSGTNQVGAVEVFDPVAARWSDLAPMPHPRNHLSGYVDGERLCVTGGREPATSARTDCLDPASSRWTAAPSLPTATSGAAAAMVAGEVVVAGGEPANETSLVTTVFEGRDGQWSNVGMLVPRHGTGYVVFHDRLWMCGGASAPGVHAVSSCTSLGAG